jgi:hypothetical protein
MSKVLASVFRELMSQTPEEAIGLFERLVDDLGLAQAWFTMAAVHNLLGHERENDWCRQALALACATGRRPAADRVRGRTHPLRDVFLSDPLEETVDRLRELHEEFGHLPSVRLWGVALGSFEPPNGNLRGGQVSPRGLGGPGFASTAIAGL